MTTSRTKFTVYAEPKELLGIDQAVLHLREHYGIKVDRSRFVLEALKAVTVGQLAAQIAEGD